MLTTLFLAAGVLTRFYHLSQPSQVVFDEVHFGTQASYYITGLYYYDVHPPLGKMILALAGWLAGYDGTFIFKSIGLSYHTGDTQVPF